MNQLVRLRKELDKAKAAIEKESEQAEASDKKPADSKNESDDDSDDANSGESKKADDEPGDGDDSEADKAESESNSKKPDASDEGLDALKAALKGEMPVYIYCDVAMDVATAVKLTDDYQLDTIFVLGRDCHKAAKLLAGAKRAVILDSTLVFWETDPRTREDKRIVVPAVLLEAGVPFIFQTDDPGSRRTIGNSYFWFQAATAIKYGMDQADALAAITLEPAKLLGIDSIVGSIEVGKDANLMVLTGEPLDISTWVEQTIIGGQVVYQRSEDEKLERLLSPTAE